MFVEIVFKKMNPNIDEEVAAHEMVETDPMDQSPIS